MFCRILQHCPATLLADEDVAAEGTNKQAAVCAAVMVKILHVVMRACSPTAAAA